MSALLQILAIILVSLPAQDPSAAKSPQDKRGLEIRPVATPSSTPQAVASVQTRPEPVAQMGHYKPVSILAFSPDGHFLASGSQDATVRLWDARVGKEARSFVGHTDTVDGIAFSSDGRFLVSVASFKEKSIRLWDIYSGDAVHQWEGTAAAFSPDGRFLFWGGKNNAVGLWDLKARAPGRSFEIQREKAFDTVMEKWEVADITTVAFNSDGRFVAAGTTAGTIHVWDVSKGKRLRLLKGHTDGVRWVAVTSDGRRIVSAGRYDRSVRWWDVESGSALHVARSDKGSIRSLALGARYLVAATSERVVYIWDASGGGEQRVLQTEDVDNVRFSSDGKWLLTQSRWKLWLWDAATLSLAMESSGPRIGTLQAIAFSPDGNEIALGDFDGRVALWRRDRSKGDLVFEPHSKMVSTVAVSADGRYLAAGGHQYSVQLWDAVAGQLIRSFQQGLRSLPLENYLPYVGFSPDSRYLYPCYATGLWRHMTGVRRCVQDLTNGSALGGFEAGGGFRVFKSQYSIDFSKEEMFLNSVAFSADGRLMVAASGKNKFSFGWDLGYDGTQQLRAWDVLTGKTVLYKELENSVNAAAFTPDGRYVIAGMVSQLQVWDLQTSNRILTSDTPGRANINALAVSSDGRQVAVAQANNLATLWDIQSGKLLSTFTGHEDDVLAVGFISGGNRLVTAGNDRTLRFWDSVTGKTIKILRGHSGPVTALSVSGDGRWIFSASADGTVRIWETSTGEQRAVVVFLPKSSDWAVLTPDGLFDGTQLGIQRLVAWRFSGNEMRPLELFFSEFYHPGLLGEILMGKAPKAPRDFAQLDRRQPQVKLMHADSQPVTTAVTSSRAVKLTIEVSEAPANEQRSAGSGVRDVRLFRNGLLVKVWRGDVLNGKASTTLNATIPIVAGENRLTAYAFNRDNIKSSDATLIVKGAESLRRKGVAYILAAGVNEYANRDYNLNFAVADAQAFSEEIKRQQTKLNQYERVEVLPLNDTAATKAAILSSLANLTGKTQPEDAVFIFFAGHGTAQGNRFYLIPHDLGHAGSRTQLDNAGLRRILEHSISDEELQLAVEGIDAGQLIMVIDACNSGQALEAEEKRRGPMNSKGLAQLAYEKGMYILTAAQSYQAALEAAKLGHGYLTYALVEEGLKTNVSDRAPKDGQVLVREWLDFATARVPEMQMEKIEEQRKMGRELGLLIKFVETDTGADRNVQRPRVFYRREAETAPMIVAKP